MNVLLSIKPKYANLIFNGKKLYEFRKSIFKQQVQKIIVYSSYPVSRLIGEIEYDCIICKTPHEMWIETKHCSGISKEVFFDYFKGRKKAYAIKIKSFTRYRNSIKIEDKYPGIKPPQSFRYIM